MATKSYSKHKEYKEFSSKGVVPYTDEQFDMMKSELLPRSKIDSLSAGAGTGSREYQYEYREDKHPSGKYDRKDLHTVEQFTIPAHSTPKSNESSSYYYEREERQLPAITTSYNYDSSYQSTPGYSKIKSSKKETNHNVEELDSLLDDLQKDQERQLYKSGYTSDTAESSSFDYRRGTTPVKTPSSGYSTLKAEERMESWGSSTVPARQSEIRQEMFREERTESRVVPSQVSPAIPQPVPATLCAQCHQPGTLSRSGTPMNKVRTTVKTYTYEVPADTDPTSIPLTQLDSRAHSHERTYLSTNENISANTIPPSPSLGCQYCSHCNSRLTKEYVSSDRHAPPPAITHTTHYSSDDRSSERVIYPKPANEVLSPPDNRNGHGPYGPSYKYSETSYSSVNTTERIPPATPPFPRSPPSPAPQQPPKKLDDLLADFPETRFESQIDGVRRRTEVQSKPPASPAPARNVAGPAVYYPPGHTPFAKKDAPVVQHSAAMREGGGAYASGRGMYEYESGSKSKEKHSEKKTAVPVCLPLCCAMPCVIM